jgi:gliding motility-associated-like protein
MWFKRLILFISAIVFSSFVFATHNRAGEITYRWISGLTYEATITTYTYTQTPADRCELELFWGDGTSDTIARINGPSGGGCEHYGEIVAQYIKKNIYKGTHTYSAPSTYLLYFEDPNRNGGIINIPNSVNVPFYVQSVLVISPFLGPNNSPILLNPPIDNACLNYPFIHNPGAYDIDGDSLSYRLISCKGEKGLDIPGYTFPQASNSFSMNPVTGDLLWDSPVQQGEYNVAFLIEEWRNGVLIGYVTRDMQITVGICDNNRPPEIITISKVCVEAGDTLQFDVTATDPDNDLVTLTGYGGPLTLPVSPATFNQPVSGNGTVTSTFEWKTVCSHIRNQPYFMTFKAEDNGLPIHLFTIKTVEINVVPPGPKNLNAIPVGNGIHLTWNKAICSGTNASGYKIYRRNGFYGFIPADCETGVPAYTGYTKIADINNINTTTYIDNNGGYGLIHGVDYCYLVIAYYKDGSESYASNETCAELKRDVPIITNISIKNTSAINGSVYVAWSKPTELDTILAPGPYKYLIYRSPNFPDNYQLIDSVYGHGLNDTLYNDTLLNTKDFSHYYRIALYNDTPGNRFLIGYTEKASSVFINIKPSDNELLLSWDEIVPWTNSVYTVYRLNNATNIFDSVGYSNTKIYTDKELVNGTTYFYKVKSKGKYSATGFIDPIINFSQINSSVPIDTTAPCCPDLNITPDCYKVENTLVWNNPNNSCANDVVKYEVWYSPTLNGEVSLIHTANSPLDTVFIHSNLNTIVGCYTVYAIDSFANKNVLCEPVCIDIDNCPRYRLPNVFTPDNDGYNDLLIPFPYTFVEKIELKLFNRWGELVFETNDPDINWDGKNLYSKMPCSDGVYFYTCDVYEIRLTGVKVRQLQGSVHILRK